LYYKQISQSTFVSY